MTLASLLGVGVLLISEERFNTAEKMMTKDMTDEIHKFVAQDISDITFELTDHEIDALKQLLDRDGEATRSGNKRNDDLDRLVKAGLITKQSAHGATDVVIYTLTEKGRAFMSQKLGLES
jgi:hypothetical protein